MEVASISHFVFCRIAKNIEIKKQSSMDVNSKKIAYL